MSYGITPTGFNKKPLSAIKTDIEEALRSVFGEITVEPASVFGQIIGVLSKPEADVWELCEVLYNTLSPQRAEGVILDDICAYTGISRLAATYTLVTVLLEGTEGTLVPAATLGRMLDTQNIFELEVDTTIAKASVVNCRVSIDAVVAAYDYTIYIDGTPYVYTCAVATVEEIADNLASVINFAQSRINCIPYPDGSIDMIMIDKRTVWAVDIAAANMSFDYMATPSTFKSQVIGRLICPANTLTEILTPVSGLNSIYNQIDGDTGRDIEDDISLRGRREASLQVTGAATVDAITARLFQEVANVATVKVIENYEEITVDGRPPKSFESVVEGGDEDDIAAKIWEVKPAGIRPFGTITKQVTDSQGDLQTVQFSRPTYKYAHVRVSLTLNPEETFPEDGLETIEGNILSVGNTLGIGDDIVVQKFTGAIFAVEGVYTAVIEVAITPTPFDIPVYQTTNIAIDKTEIAVFSLGRIHVNIV